MLHSDPAAMQIGGAGFWVVRNDIAVGGIF
jgi:hypothetical protein